MAAGHPSIAITKQQVATGDRGGLVRLARDPASLRKHCGSTRSLICCSAHIDFRPRHNRLGGESSQARDKRVEP